MHKKTLVVLLMIICANIAYADCTYKGEQYPEGSIIGPLICKNGRWVKK